MLKGKLVGLRALEESDLSLLRDWRNIPEFRRNFREHRELGMANQTAWFANVSKSRNDYMFVIEELATSEPIGACGLLYTDWIIRSTDFSFYIGKDQAYIDQQGMAHDAAKVLIDYGFEVLNLNKIWMELYEFDDQKLKFFLDDFGFTKDGKLRSNAFANGKYWDSYIISMLSSEWNANKESQS